MLSEQFNTSFRCLKLNGVAGRTLIAIIGHYNIHPVVTIRDKTGQGPRQTRSISFKTLGLNPPAHSVPGQATALSPVINLRNQPQLHQQPISFTACK